MNDYDWDGNWQAPKHGSYVIMENGRELEPHEVIDYLRRLDDLLVQATNVPTEARQLYHALKIVMPWAGKGVEAHPSNETLGERALDIGNKAVTAYENNTPEI